MTYFRVRLPVFARLLLSLVLAASSSLAAHASSAMLAVDHVSEQKTEHTTEHAQSTHCGGNVSNESSNVSNNDDCTCPVLCHMNSAITSTLPPALQAAPTQEQRAIIPPPRTGIYTPPLRPPSLKI